jgi:histidinol-phosphate aminotransferase
VLVFNGSDAALRNCFECLISDGTNVNVIEPEYNQINTFVHMSGGQIQSILLDDPFNLNVIELLQYLNKDDILYISNPSNPTGRLLSRSDILQLLDAGIVLCLDEAYIEFASPSSSELVEEYANLFVFRTFSKAFGLAGARLGYILSHSQNINLLAKNRNSKDINAFSQIAVLEALKNIDIFYDRINTTISERNSFVNFINSLDSDITARNTHANFVLLKSPRINEFLDYLFKDKILIRDRQGMHKMELTARLTIGTPNQMVKLKKSISKFF